MVLLNPSAPTFTLGANRSGSADSELSKSQCSTSSISTESEFLDFPPRMKVHPLVPPNTPEGEQVDVVELGVNKHLATRLGEGWKTTFPVSATPGTKTSKHLDVPLNKDRSFVPSHRSRSPSLPGLLPSDEARNDARPPRDLSLLFQRLAASSQVNGVPYGLREEMNFDPFDEGNGYPSTAEQRTYAPTTNSQRLAAFGQPNPPVVPVYAYPTHSDNGTDILSTGDIGEGRNGELGLLLELTIQCTSLTCTRLSRRSS